MFGWLSDKELNQCWTTNWTDLTSYQRRSITWQSLVSHFYDSPLGGFHQNWSEMMPGGSHFSAYITAIVGLWLVWRPQITNAVTATKPLHTVTRQMKTVCEWSIAAHAALWCHWHSNSGSFWCIIIHKEAILRPIASCYCDTRLV